MSIKQPHDTDLESLLKRTLTDDLPPDVAAGLRERLDRFRERAGEKARRSGAPTFLVRRAAWAAISILMLVSGSLLQGLGSRSPLADRVSAIGTSQTVSRLLATAQTMSCSARVLQDDGSFLIYEITRLENRGTMVVVKGPDGAVREKYEAAEEDLSHAPLLRPVTSILDPAALRDLLSGDWRFIRFSQEGKCHEGTYTSTSPDARMGLEFTIDLCTYLPVRINASESAPLKAGGTGKILWEARFEF